MPMSELPVIRPQLALAIARGLKASEENSPGSAIFLCAPSFQSGTRLSPRATIEYLLALHVCAVSLRFSAGVYAIR